MMSVGGGNGTVSRVVYKCVLAMNIIVLVCQQWFLSVAIT